jgi:hypothetical protein
MFRNQPTQLLNKNFSKIVPKAIPKRLNNNKIDPAIYVVEKNVHKNADSEKIKGEAVGLDTSFSDKSVFELKKLVDIKDKKTKTPMPTKKLSPKLKSPKPAQKSPSIKNNSKGLLKSNSKNLNKTSNSNKCCNTDSKESKQAKVHKKSISPAKKNSISEKNRPNKPKTYLKLIISDPNSSKVNLKPKLIAKTNSSKISSPNKSPILKTIYRIDSKGYIHKV